MKIRKIDLSDAVSERESKKVRNFKRIFFVLSIVGLLIGLSLFWSIFAPLKPGGISFPGLPVADPIKSTEGRVNILLFGIGGGTHEGPDLTDSIIVASLNLKTKQTVMFSIPRDLWMDNIKQRINATYEIGKKTGSGLSFAEDKIDDILGLTIHYGVLINFDGFGKAIDLVDGIDIEVPTTFDDYEYPITGEEDNLCGLHEQEVDLNEDQAKALNREVGKAKVLVNDQGKIASTSADFACRFEHIHFDKGSNHLNGPIALTFVRSRHGTNGEGSDFARSRRQQLVIEAFGKKALSLPTLINPSKLIDLYTTFSKSVETDIPRDKFLEFYNLAKNNKKTVSVVLGDLGNGGSLFINPSPADYGGAWVLIPKDRDFSKIADFVHQTLIQADQEATRSAKPSL
ncbi:hypothetical protein A2631_04675 [Candidatus Daviesbacteria bacterium RIFCSPHIGHO2_01_FULL_44_29]|uniref:Cell envelope-related transcriptional attenuator domain-containing protein n=1 Tax=Candidatus Daviesbacteria bacterium RIFCSPHIGHO2_02_FULL_43_12 TaxID=1797776 RepID=A0A1F5KGT8_9BACT|nr:MAG: hypothetical protein A2631_04675 [Candidatus Daviesbacteria bacterium RIFCSPHIGHO2_01_FULL_44_29]OGE40015.1 MAG: hypothetical protein A3D25_04405 [Candidatus Daviesbacteria bacterium RIFCSPHIGHO2_02_FULL_43_12]OGE41502.1 MAG: hypothetical protein A3E86_05405 [Candidatus Daviesbacteria bacterium RIFCSPHIGHO2_12_FULL_47_45]OGE70304.1 MAG: hypothetical protein A3B55_01165 [Candidatus Daviesbacteria bacterium RIFCSPLOWO2_01_FULL_43_15]